MRNYKNFYFCNLDEIELDTDRKNLLAIAALEYLDFYIISSSETLLIDTARYVKNLTEVRPTCVLAPSDILQGTAENFLASACLGANTDARFFKFNLANSHTSEVTQVLANGFQDSQDFKISYIYETQGLHPVVKNTIESTCTQHNELTTLTARLLIGYSYLPDHLLRQKNSDSDLDGLQLHELKAFTSHLQANIKGFHSIEDNIKSLINYCSSLLFVCPSNASDLSNSHPSTALQNGFPCIYKVMSVFHYLAYELSMRKKLYNKAFMHIFRSLECYCSGAMFLDDAKIANHTTKNGTSKDVYIIGNNEKVRGFGRVFSGLGNYFKLGTDKDYNKCQFYLDLRNRFHYTHGDLKPSEHLVRDFSRAVARQILKVETAGKQTTFLWRDLYRQTKYQLMREPTETVRTSIFQALRTDKLSMFMVP
ncbi:hypothetical protein [Pseudomonas capsici]|uniref:hypothetical protein n=1 Tax=Pseudomonas capsici TaxID=2810614 RepID=UPI0021F1B6B7|nr:hypothetical protein [Pseudomonas capsici]MCV4263537.1 hypothetical protein [Pseudomonas capsici]